MLSILLSLLLALQLTCTNLPSALPPDPGAQPRQLWWGMIDPELSSWFARIPGISSDAPFPVSWNWSWKSFWAALIQQPLVKETADAPYL